VPTVIEFVDIAGLVKGASRGEGLGNKFLGNIREVDAIIHVIRCFDDPNIVHVNGKVDPISDKEIIDTELQLKDLESVEKKLQKVEKNARVGGDARAKKEVAVLEQYRQCLMQGKNARSLEMSEEDKFAVADLQLLTIKPVIYAANVDESTIGQGTNQWVEALIEGIKGEKAEVIVLCAAIEAQIAELTDPEEKAMFLQEYGLTESGLNKLIRASYTILDLITYFTAGVKEVRAWTIKKGWKAPQAAGVIHTDFEKGFIKAEVIKYKDFEHLGSELSCKEAGKMAMEGKEYIVGDGDIMHFRFNV